MEERKHAQKLITFTIQPASRRPISPINIRALQDVGHNVQMCQAHALGQACGAGAVHQKDEVLLRVDVGLPEAGGEVDALDVAEVLELLGRVAVLADQDDAVVRDAGLLRGFNGSLEEGSLRDDGLGARVFELEGEFFDGVERIGGRDDGAGPDGAKSDDGGLGGWN